MEAHGNFVAQAFLLLVLVFLSVEVGKLRGELLALKAEVEDCSPP